MTTDDTPRGATTATTATAAPWFGIQTFGPVLMILFGLVLMFTPIASVGAAGSVGNAGAQFPKCPPGGGGQIGDGGNGGSAGILSPGDLDGDCPTPTTAAPTTAPPTSAPPGTEAPAGTTPPDGPATPVDAPAPPGGEPGDDPEVGGIVVEAPPADAEVLDTGVEAGSASGAGGGHDTAELAFTGPESSSLVATLLGATSVLGGGVLLFTARRRTSTTC